MLQAIRPNIFKSVVFTDSLPILHLYHYTIGSSWVGKAVFVSDGCEFGLIGVDQNFALAVYNLGGAFHDTLVLAAVAVHLQA